MLLFPWGFSIDSSPPAESSACVSIHNVYKLPGSTEVRKRIVPAFYDIKPVTGRYSPDPFSPVHQGSLRAAAKARATSNAKPRAR